MLDLKYQQALRKAFLDLHGYKCLHIETAPVMFRSQGKIVWKGDVEVF